MLLFFLLVFSFLVGNCGNNGEHNHYKQQPTCIKRPKPPKFLPVPNPMSTDTIRQKLVGSVWPQLYLHFTQDTDIAFIDAVQVRLKFDISDDGNTLFRTFSFRTNVSGDCMLFDQVYKRIRNTKKKGIFLREQDDSMRQERYFSSCPDKYFWVWICRDCKTVKHGRCKGDAFLGLHAKEPANQVPFDLAAKDLKKYGLSFEDPRFKITHDGNRCPV